MKAVKLVSLGLLMWHFVPRLIRFIDYLNPEADTANAKLFRDSHPM